jgi:hypothetical protein
MPRNNTQKNRVSGSGSGGSGSRSRSRGRKSKEERGRRSRSRGRKSKEGRETSHEIKKKRDRTRSRSSEKARLLEEEERFKIEWPKYLKRQKTFEDARYMTNPEICVASPGTIVIAIIGHGDIIMNNNKTDMEKVTIVNPPEFEIYSLATIGNHVAVSAIDIFNIYEMLLRNDTIIAPYFFKEIKKANIYQRPFNSFRSQTITTREPYDKNFKFNDDEGGFGIYCFSNPFGITPGTNLLFWRPFRTAIETIYKENLDDIRPATPYDTLTQENKDSVYIFFIKNKSLIKLSVILKILTRICGIGPESVIKITDLSCSKPDTIIEPRMLRRIVRNAYSKL